VTEDSWTPDRGDLVSAFMKDQGGYEQAGRRPFLVLTPAFYNAESSTVIGCPVTSNLDPFAFKIFLPVASPVRGAVLVDQVRSLDLSARRSRMLGRVADETLAEVTAMLASLLRIAP
jgi:mRNA interferase MazF